MFLSDARCDHKTILSQMMRMSVFAFYLEKLLNKLWVVAGCTLRKWGGGRSFQLNNSGILQREASNTKISREVSWKTKKLSNFRHENSSIKNCANETRKMEREFPGRNVLVVLYFSWFSYFVPSFSLRMSIRNKCLFGCESSPPKMPR